MSQNSILYNLYKKNKDCIKLYRYSKFLYSIYINLFNIQHN